MGQYVETSAPSWYQSLNNLLQGLRYHSELFLLQILLLANRNFESNARAIQTTSRYSCVASELLFYPKELRYCYQEEQLGSEVRHM